jgi:hypothetical protein
MKKNIELSIEEIRTTSTLVIKKFNLDFIDEQIKVNSNPANYSKLQEEILQKFGLEVGNRFLCKYLFESQSITDDLMVFRKDRVEALYKYFSNQSRYDYLQNHSILPIKVLYIPKLTSFDNNKIEVSEFINIAQHKNIFLEERDFENIVTTDASQFWNFINNESLRLIICVNSSILQDLDGIQRLKELIFKYTSRLVVESNINFLFSQDLFKDSHNINRLEGKNKFFEYWNDEKNNIESLESKPNYPSEIRKLLTEKKVKIQNIIENIFKILDSLVALYKIKGDVKAIESKNTVEIIQPITAKISGCEIRKLTDVISDLEYDNTTRDLLCVISYEKYFHNSERNEMLSYFKMFYDKLGKHNIIRAYCLKGKKNTRNQFTATLKKSENINAYDYIQITSPKNNFSSYLLVYNESPFRVGGQRILYEQDYILSIPKQIGFDYHSQINIDERINEVLQSEDVLNDTKLFLTYPENPNGENQMIELTDLNDVALRKWLSDFCYRINTNIKTDNHETFKFVKNKDENIRKILKIK